MHNNNLSLKTLKLLFKVLPILFWMLLLFGFDIPYIAVITLISAVIHELSHITASILLAGGFRFRGAVSGFRLALKNKTSYRAEILIAAAGPLSNLAVFLIIMIFLPRSGYAMDFGIINLLTAISNLLPIEGYDGYRILECAALELGLAEGFTVLLKALSFTLISAFTFIALYFMKRLDGGYWIFFVFISILIKTVKKDEKRFIARKREKK